VVIITHESWHSGGVDEIVRSEVSPIMQLVWSKVHFVAFHPTHVVHVCFHQEETRAVKAQVAFDIDSFSWICQLSGRGTARSVVSTSTSDATEHDHGCPSGESRVPAGRGSRAGPTIMSGHAQIHPSFPPGEGARIPQHHRSCSLSPYGLGWGLGCVIDT